MYDHRNKSKATLADCKAAIGQTATLPLTGRIVEAGVSPAGPYVKFEIDERWGLEPPTRFVFDLDALDLEPPTPFVFEDRP